MAVIDKLSFHAIDRETSTLVSASLLDTGGVLVDNTTSDSGDTDFDIYDFDIELKVSRTPALDALIKSKEARFFKWGGDEYELDRLVRKDNFTVMVYGKTQ